jgi:hypothetical protein
MDASATFASGSPFGGDWKVIGGSVVTLHAAG